MSLYNQLFVHHVCRDFVQSPHTSSKRETNHGLKFGHNITISDLLFADCYTVASEKTFNIEKSSIFFSGNVKDN